MKKYFTAIFFVYTILASFSQMNHGDLNSLLIEFKNTAESMYNIQNNNTIFDNSSFRDTKIYKLIIEIVKSDDISSQDFVYNNLINNEKEKNIEYLHEYIVKDGLIGTYLEQKLRLFILNNKDLYIYTDIVYFNYKNSDIMINSLEFDDYLINGKFESKRNRIISKILLEYFNTENFNDRIRTLLNEYLLYVSKSDDGEISDDLFPYILLYGDSKLFSINKFLDRPFMGSAAIYDILNIYLKKYKDVKNIYTILLCYWDDKEVLLKAINEYISVIESKHSDYSKIAILVRAYLTDDIDKLIEGSMDKYNPEIEAFSLYALGEEDKVKEILLRVIKNKNYDQYYGLSGLLAILSAELKLIDDNIFINSLYSPFIFEKYKEQYIPFNPYLAYNDKNENYKYYIYYIYPYYKLIKQKDNDYINNYFGNYLLKSANNTKASSDVSKKGIKEAISYFKSMNKSEAIFRLAEIWFDKEDYTFATELYRQCNLENIDIFLGGKFANIGKYSYAKPYLKKGGYTDKEIIMTFGEIAYTREEFDLAMKYFQEIGDKDMIMKTEYNIANNEKSITMYKDYLKKYPNSEYSNEVIGKISAIESIMNEINNNVIKAEELFNNEKYDEAYQGLKQLINKYSKNDEKDVKEKIKNVSELLKNYYIKTDYYKNEIEKNEKYEEEKNYLIQQIKPKKQFGTFGAMIRLLGNNYIIKNDGSANWNIKGHEIQVFFNQYGGIEIIIIDEDIVL